MESLMGKGRRPKFELKLKIYDLNNVPLVSGSSYIKWHLAHSIHAEHRGRTAKCPIVNHRVDYNFSKTVQHIRVSVDKQNHLTECPLEFEVVQEFNLTDKITLGVVKLNLSEYVEESEALVKDHLASPGRGRTNSAAGVSPTSVLPSATDGGEGPEGIVRRHLMQESKINSTLKISILMTQIDGDRNFIAPTLKTAPTFGGIAGIVSQDHGNGEEDQAGPTPSTGFSKPRDTTEIQDLYRRTLSASWSRLPSELPADECIEDIFNGGNGWRTHHAGQNDNLNATDTEEDDEPHGQGTLRPSDFKRLTATNPHSHHRTHGHHQGHRRTGSAASDRSTMTVTARAAAGIKNARAGDSPSETSLSRSGSLTTLSSERSRGEAGLVRNRAKEVEEAEMRDDLVAWRLPSKDGVTA